MITGIEKASSVSEHIKKPKEESRADSAIKNTIRGGLGGGAIGGTVGLYRGMDNADRFFRDTHPTRSSSAGDLYHSGGKQEGARGGKKGAIIGALLGLIYGGLR